MFGLFQHAPDDETPPEAAPALSVLGKGTTARGSFDLKEDDLRIDGVLEGDVQTEGRVHVAQGGAVQGEIQAGSIRVAGTVEGVLCACQNLVLLESAAVHGILCAEALTIEDEADFEGGICNTADRIPALKAVFASADTYTIPDLVSPHHETAADPSSQPTETADGSVTLDIEQSSFPENTVSSRSLQEGDALPEAASPSAAPPTEESSVDPSARETEEADDTEPLSTLEW